MLYANDFDIKGLIASTGVWKLSDPATDVIHECIDGYAKGYPNLILQDNAYPSPVYLHGVTTAGNRGYGMSHVSGRGSAGARLIIDAADQEDNRPLWLLVWEVPARCPSYMDGESNQNGRSVYAFFK